MRQTFLMPTLLLMFASTAASSATLLVTNLGDGPGNCPSPVDCTLRAAIAAALPNDRIEFDPALGFPANLTLQGTELAISKNLTIVGPGADRLSVQAAASRRVLSITAGTVVIERLELANGRQIATNGTSGPPGSGASGAGGIPAEGGCVRTSAGTSLTLNQVAVRDCMAQGGSGGAGGSGVNGSPPSNGGQGGSGGLARGGAVFAQGQLSLLNSSISAAAAVGGIGGAGGAGGNGGIFSTEGRGGNGGASGAAQGGAVYAGPGAAVLIRNSTLVGNSVTTRNGGRGGDGGDGNAVGVGPGGNGGNAASAHGGHLFLDTNLALADIEFSSIGPADLTAGIGGDRGQGDPDGSFGLSGLRAGEGVFAATPPRIRSSLVVGSNAAPDCSGSSGVAASGNNADSDDSCAGFTRVGTFAANFRSPPFATESGRAVMLPLAGSMSIDSAVDCTDLAGAAVTSDQSARARPLDGDGNGSAICDLGAVEFNIALFANGFE